MAEVLHEKWVTGRNEKESLRARIGDWRCGRWTPAEVKKLRKNVRKYLKSKGVGVQEVVFNTACGQREEFFRCAARGIKRPLFSVYRKVCRVYHVGNGIGRWSARLTGRLIRNQCRHGNNWALIGRKIGVSARAARDKYRNIAARQRTGKWLPDEVERLKYAMERVNRQQSLGNSSSTSQESSSSHPDSHSTLEEPRSDPVACVSLSDSEWEEPVVSAGGVSDSLWEGVARLVASRNSVQCRQKWLFHLDWQQRGGVAMWGPQDDKTLLEVLLTRAGGGAEDEDDIEWAELASEWESARWSPYYLRTKWTSMRRQVPRYNFNSFQENLAYLEEALLPVLLQSNEE